VYAWASIEAVDNVSEFLCFSNWIESQSHTG
jgi:hypothetical protein